MGRLYSLNETILDGLAEMILDEVIDDHDPDEAVLILAKQGRGRPCATMATIRPAYSVSWSWPWPAC